MSEKPQAIMKCCICGEPGVMWVKISDSRFYIEWTKVPYCRTHGEAEKLKVKDV